MTNPWSMIILGVSYFLELVRWLLVAYCVLSWFVSPRNKLMRFLTRLTDPLLNPVRSMLFRSTNRYPSDIFAPIIAFLVITFLKGMLFSLL